MPSYKDQDGKIHYIDDKRHEHLLPGGCIAITDAEAESLQNPPVTLAEAKDNAINEVKAEANRRIERIVPIWKQINSLADGDPDDVFAITVIPIRNASNEIENEINAKLEVGTVLAFDITNHNLWPE
ncbi:MAG: hypothetical protein KAR40_13935 [Candidatus Sabulitectum sp.]|nr:hypothetical protein [Candidatus Sabulitectum sp.]